VSLPAHGGWRDRPIFRRLDSGTAFATLIRQRHPVPSCGGPAPTAERTVGPARIVAESSTSDPGIREQNRHLAESFGNATTSTAIPGCNGHAERVHAKPALGIEAAAPSLNFTLVFSKHTVIKEIWERGNADTLDGRSPQRGGASGTISCNGSGARFMIPIRKLCWTSSTAKRDRSRLLTLPRNHGCQECVAGSSAACTCATPSPQSRTIKYGRFF